MRLTEHFTLEEMTRTSVKGVDNTPTVEQVGNLKRVCSWLEELREEYNRRYGTSPEEELMGKEAEPIIINSGFRSRLVNKAVGGVPESNHLTGCAADIRVLGKEQLLRYATILLDISDESGEDFDELILERNKKGTMWLHFAVRGKNNRRKIIFNS